MAGTSLLFGLLLLIGGATLWIVATQTASNAQKRVPAPSAGRRWATRQGAVVSVVAGAFLFVTRTESLWLLVAVTVGAFALMGAAARS